MPVREQASAALAEETAGKPETMNPLLATRAESAIRTPVPVGEPFGLPAGWWPVAFGFEVDGNPRGIRLGEQEVVLYRDKSSAVRAMVDRCPHRRLPLSMGRVIDDGLQCGYHGWTFDGASGQCTLIPNFRPDEKPSGRIRIPAYSVTEAAGLVFVWTGQGAVDAAAAPVPSAGADAVGSQGRVVHGTVEVRASHALLAEALLFNPGAALGLGWLLGGGDEVLGPDVDVTGQDVTGQVVSARRLRLTFDLPRVRTFDPVSSRATAATTRTSVATGTTVVVADAPVGTGTFRVLVSLTPNGKYRTAVRWQIEAYGSGALLATLACRVSGVTQRLTGGVVGALEKAADAAEVVTDPAVDRLRELQATPAGKDA